MNSNETSRRGFLKQATVGAAAAVTSMAGSGTTQALPVAPASPQPRPYRVGQWLPSDGARLNLWLADLKSAAAANPQPLHPVVAEFRDLIESDPEVYMCFHQMFDELPSDKSFETDPMGQPQVRDYETMLTLINHVLTHAPVFDQSGLVGFPINAILAWPMGTTGGFAAFLNDKVNRSLKKILNAWGDFLSSPDSRYVLSTDPTKGWFGRDALAAMPGFVDDFQCDPAQPHYGFKSWDDFFTRRFRDGRRPVAAPDDTRVIVSACESAPYKIAVDVKDRDLFWIKSQPYSLVHMFSSDPVHAEFVGGTVYQAFLSALSYHRWHSPVDGIIERAWRIDGSYYSQTPSVGYDPSSPDQSQGFITEVATRAVVLIRADDPAIGLMAFLAVGMAEVSTCEVTVAAGQRVKKGDEIGTFHFGGSSHCLIFRPGVKLEFDLGGQQPGTDARNILVNSALARVVS
jgi:phosphatidylserine decarboxylase